MRFFGLLRQRSWRYVLNLGVVQIHSRETHLHLLLRLRVVFVFSSSCFDANRAPRSVRQMRLVVPLALLGRGIGGICWRFEWCFLARMTLIFCIGLKVLLDSFRLFIWPCL